MHMYGYPLPQAVRFPAAFPTLRTPRLVLRQVTDADLAAIHQGLSDPAVTRYFAVHFDTIEQTAQEQMPFIANHWTAQTGVWWALALADSPHSLIGKLGVYGIDTAHAHAEFGGWLLPGYWRQGLMHEASLAAIDFAFASLHLHRLYATIEAENQASQAWVRRLGFVPEGTLRHAEWKFGRWIDLQYWGLLADQWPPSNSPASSQP